MFTIKKVTMSNELRKQKSFQEGKKKKKKSFIPKPPNKRQDIMPAIDIKASKILRNKYC
jgi:hypothetical protein